MSTQSGDIEDGEKKPLLINHEVVHDGETGAEEPGKEEMRRPTRWQIFLFTSLQAGMSFMFGITGGWLAFHYLPPEDTGHDKLINTAVYSGIVLVGRVLNGVAEPWIGYFSDRCDSSFGRRRPFILLATPLMAASFALLWFMPFEPMSVGAAMWFFVFYVLNNFFSACVMAPYMALMPEITNDRQVRITISASQGVWGMLGNLVVASVGPVDNALEDGVDVFGYNMSGLQLISTIMSFVMVILCWMPLLAVKERPVEKHQISDFSILGELKVAFSNSAFISYITYMSMTITGVSMFQAASPFICTVVLETEGGLVQPGKGETWVGIFAFITLIGALIGTPIISVLAKRFGKKRILLIAAGLMVVTFFLVFFIQYMSDPGIGMLVFMIVGALPITATFTLPNAVFADVVQHDEKITGKRREGMYTGARLLVIRVVTGVGSFLLMPIISIGDTPENPIGIMLIYPIACLASLIGFVAFLRYPHD